MMVATGRWHLRLKILVRSSFQTFGATSRGYAS